MKRVLGSIETRLFGLNRVGTGTDVRNNEITRKRKFVFYYCRNNQKKKQKNTRERKENWMSEPISRPISWKEFPEYLNGNFVLKCKKRMEAVQYTPCTTQAVLKQVQQSNLLETKFR